MRQILQRYLRAPVTEESHGPFISGDKPEYHMDLVLPAGSFPVTGLDDPQNQGPVMVDVSCFEAQCASHARKTAADPARCGNERAQAKRTHYSAHYEQDCYKLATLAIGSFGTVSAEGHKLLDAIAEEWASREENMLASSGVLKGVAAGRIRAALSTALHMGLSERVIAYWGMPGVRSGAGIGTGVRGMVYEEHPGSEHAPWVMVL